MPGTLSVFAGVGKAGIALKPTHRHAWVLALSWTRLGAPDQALNLSHQGWSSARKALERKKPCVNNLACCLLRPTMLRRYSRVWLAGGRSRTLAKVFKPVLDVEKTAISLSLVSPMTHVS